ncbi:MAG: hypothetical protein ACE5K4_12075 [Candidatus Hydrothermarchaeota archaeon]
MVLVAVKFPKENWKKVNVSKFLSKFDSLEVSKIVNIPDENLEHVLEVLNRNDCKVEVLRPAQEDIEKMILKRIKEICEGIRKNIIEPRALDEFAVKCITEFSLKNLSEELTNILHDSIEFGENPSLIALNQIEKKTNELLRKKITP